MYGIKMSYLLTHLVVLVLILVSASKANCLALTSRTTGLASVLKMLASNLLLVKFRILKLRCLFFYCTEECLLYPLYVVHSLIV